MIKNYVREGIFPGKYPEIRESSGQVDPCIKF